MAGALFRIALFVGSTFVLICLLAFLLQDRLLFSPQPLDPARRQVLQHSPHTQAITLRTDQGLALHGWLRTPQTLGPWPLLLYFGGNGEESSHILDEAGHLPGWAVATLNYRGYGDSEGKPDEAALMADAARLYDWARQRQDIQANRIVAMGRSLGSGVAVGLAARRSVAGVVLLTPYDNLPAVAGRHYPWLPVRLLLKYRFDSLSLAEARTEPTLFLVAGNDEIIPPAHALRLYQQWRGGKQWVLLAGAGHNDVDLHPDYQPALQAFLQGLAR